MNIADFRDLLEIHGTDFRSWPSEHRAVAETLLLQNRDAQALYAKEKSFEDGLRAWTVDTDADGLAARIVARAKILPQQKPANVFQLPARRWALAASVLLFTCGILMGEMIKAEPASAMGDDAAFYLYEEQGVNL